MSYPNNWNQDDIDMHLNMSKLNNFIHTYCQKIVKTKCESDDEKESPKLIRETSSIYDSISNNSNKEY